MILSLDSIAIIERRRKDMGDLNSLANSIKENGQITPGVVRPATESDMARGVDILTTPWVLVAGGRRYAACTLAGMDTYLCHDIGELPLLQQKILELEENLNRKDLEWAEEVLLKEEIHNLRMQEPGWSQVDTAKVLGETRANVSRDLQLAKELRENPALKAAPSKASAVRMVSYEKSIAQRIAKVEGSSMTLLTDRLVTADMSAFVRTLPAHSVDLCFTDFPFGIDYNFDPTDPNKYADSQRSLMDLLTDVVPEIIRVTKPTGWLALMMGSTNYNFLVNLVENCCPEHFDYFDDWWEQADNGEWEYSKAPRCNSFKLDPSKTCRKLSVEDPEWLWYRPNSRNPSMWPELHAQNQFEKICVVNMGKAVLVKKNMGNVLMYDAIYEDRIHEMQRPHDLCLDIVSRFTLGGERVLDLCFGSGSALAAAAELQRDFLGCDLNPKNLGPAIGWVAEHMKVTA